MDQQYLEVLNVSLTTLSVKVDDDGIAVVKLDVPNAKENSFTQEVSIDFQKVTTFISKNDSIKAIVIMSGKFNSFIAGADIKLLDTFKNVEEAEKYVREAQKLLNELEKSKKPIIAAIMGTCMGGGLELALACKYRICVNDNKRTQFALPEVLLGLLPGAGGTQRLPNLISLTNALDMVLTGKSIKPEKAKLIGLIDELVEPLESEAETHHHLETVAIERAKQIASGIFTVYRSRPLTERITNFFLCRRPLLDTVVLRTAKNKIMEETCGNYPAPLKILEAVRAGLIEGNEVGFELEAKSFAQLSKSPEAAALIGIFNASTDCKKDKYGDVQKIKKIGIVGAGVTGTGIIKISIDKGLKIILVDASNESLEAAQKQIIDFLDVGVERKRYTKSERDEFLAALTFTTSIDELKNVELVFEAVLEKLEDKQKIIKTLAGIVSEDCIIATTTSCFPISSITSGSVNPERILGMHYSKPIEKTQILEIISSSSTSNDNFAKAAKLGLVQKKLIIPVHNSSFLIRCLIPVASKVIKLIQEGYSVSEIDTLTKSAGFHVGCVTVIDGIGIDVISVAAENLRASMGNRIDKDSLKVLGELVKAGFCGRKTNLGFYNYSNPKSPEINADAIEIIKTSSSKNSNPKPSSSEDCKMRILSKFVNEACFCFDEGIIASPANGDIASVFGIGFPPFKGGPFRFVDSFGTENLIQIMKNFGDLNGEQQFAPAKSLQEHAKTGALFYQKHKHIVNHKL